MIKDKNAIPSNFISEVVGAPKGEWYHENELALDMEQLIFANNNKAVFVFIDEIYIDVSVYKRVKI